jgi:hypothetical protein
VTERVQHVSARHRGHDGTVADELGAGEVSGFVAGDKRGSAKWMVGQSVECGELGQCPRAGTFLQLAHGSVE